MADGTTPQRRSCSSSRPGTRSATRRRRRRPRPGAVRDHPVSCCRRRRRLARPHRRQGPKARAPASCANRRAASAPRCAPDSRRRSRSTPRRGRVLRRRRRVRARGARATRRADPRRRRRLRRRARASRVTSSRCTRTAASATVLLTGRGRRAHAPPGHRRAERLPRAVAPPRRAPPRSIHDYNYAQVLTLDLVRKGFRYAEVPISYSFRTRASRSCASCPTSGTSCPRSGDSYVHMLMAHRFRSEVMVEGKTATYLVVPAKVIEKLGSAKRPRVRVTVGSHVFRTTVAVYGNQFFVPLNRENRVRAGVEAGQVVSVAIEVDDALRVVEVPDDLAGVAHGEAPRPVRQALVHAPDASTYAWINDAKHVEHARTSNRRHDRQAPRLAVQSSTT